MRGDRPPGRCLIGAAGPALLASLTIAAALFYIALSLWLPLLRRVITPVVSGTVLMLIAATILPVALDRVNEVPEGTADAAGPVVGNRFHQKFHGLDVVTVQVRETG